MTLLAILFGLFFERFLGSLEELRSFIWFDALVRRVRQQSWGDGPFGVAAVVMLPVVVVLLFGSLLCAIGWPLYFVFAVLVLLYSFGPRDLEAEVEAYLEARTRGDDDSALIHASGLVGNAAGVPPRQLTRSLLETLFAEAHERFFGVILWFIILGPMGALMYRLAGLLQRMAAGDSSSVFAMLAQRLHHILAWLPARLTALAYALSGSFVDAMHYWREEAPKWLEDSRFILVASGFGALRYQPADDPDVPVDRDEEDSYVREALALIRRAALVWLALLAIFTLAGWAS